MQLEFKKQNGLYEVEFEVTGDFNLHLERKNYGRVELYQKTSSETNYTSSPSYSANGDAIINLDFSMGIYPKFVKIVSYTEVEKAIVTMEGEGDSNNPQEYPIFVKVTLSNEDNDKTDTSTTGDGYKTVLGDSSWNVEWNSFTYVTAEVFYKKDEDLIPYEELANYEVCYGDAIARTGDVGLVSVNKEKNRIVAKYRTGAIGFGDYQYILKINGIIETQHYIYEV